MDYYTYQNYANHNINKSFSQQHNHVSNNQNFENYNYDQQNALSPAVQKYNMPPNYMYYNAAADNYSRFDSVNENVSVPPTHTYDLTLSKPEMVEHKTDDELWVETWLSKIGKIQINLNSTIEIKSTETQRKLVPPKHTIQIHAAKNALKNCLRVLNNLQQMEEHLRSNADTITSSEWKKKTMEIGGLKNEFSSLISQLESPETMNSLRRSVEKRKKKRINQKKRKEFNRQQIQESREHKKRLNKHIDQWLEHMKEGVERAKMEENMKKDADCVLAEVTKKKSDVRKHLSLISALSKLRSVRENFAVQRGEKVCLEDSSAFSKITERLSKMWEDSLNIYSKEEQGLRIMLEQNAVEDTIAARAARERKITQEWEEVFFGPKCVPSPAYWGLTSAEKDLDTFIAIRRSWDTFLTDPNDENGSKIPIGWALPNPETNENWTKYWRTG